MRYGFEHVPHAAGHATAASTFAPESSKPRASQRFGVNSETHVQSLEESPTLCHVTESTHDLHKGT